MGTRRQHAMHDSPQCGEELSQIGFRQEFIVSATRNRRYSYWKCVIFHGSVLFCPIFEKWRTGTGSVLNDAGIAAKHELLYRLRGVARRHEDGVSVS